MHAQPEHDEARDLHHGGWMAIEQTLDVLFTDADQYAVAYRAYRGGARLTGNQGDFAHHITAAHIADNGVSYPAGNTGTQTPGGHDI